MRYVIRVERLIEVELPNSGAAASLAGRMQRALNEATYEGTPPAHGLDARYLLLARSLHVSCRDTGQAILRQAYKLAERRR